MYAYQPILFLSVKSRPRDSFRFITNSGVSDAICSAVLCLVSVVGIVYNIVHAKVLIGAIWYNEVLEERAVRTSQISKY